VFQIAAHEDAVSLERLYEFCGIARDLLSGDHAVARVIARPFRGSVDEFVRNNAARKDFSLTPPEESLLDLLKKEGFMVVGIGKVGDIFGHRGLTEETHTENNQDGVDRILQSLRRHEGENGLIFVNLVDYDMVYGHRRDVAGYAMALEEFDHRLPEIQDAMSQDDVLVITADHGCDPTYPVHTDHTREYVPLMVHGAKLRSNVDLGTRESFADCGQTIADLLGAGQLNNGVSFKKEIENG
jgi:phosphopentomutase